MSEKYNERVRAIAEEMAAAKHESLHFMRNRFYREEIIRRYYPCARIAVKHMTDAIRKYDATRINGDPAYVERYLKEQGLIPDCAQEGGKDAAV